MPINRTTRQITLTVDQLREKVDALEDGGIIRRDEARKEILLPTAQQIRQMYEREIRRRAATLAATAAVPDGEDIPF